MDSDAGIRPPVRVACQARTTSARPMTTVAKRTAVATDDDFIARPDKRTEPARADPNNTQGRGFRPPHISRGCINTKYPDAFSPNTGETGSNACSKADESLYGPGPCEGYSTE